MGEGKFNQAIKYVLNRRLGIVTILFSITLLFSLFTYNESDPSFNVSTSKEGVDNVFGQFGSYISDLFIQTIGITSFLFCIVIFVLGIKALRQRQKSFNLLKFIALLIFLISTSSFFSATFPQVNYWGNETWGGALGYFVNNSISIIFLYPLIFVSFFLSLISLSIIFDIKLGQWKKFFYFILRFMNILTRILGKLIKFVLSLFVPGKVKSGFRMTFRKILNMKLISGFRKKIKEKIQIRKEKKEKNNGKNAKKIEQMSLFTSIHYALPQTNLLRNMPIGYKKGVEGIEELRKQASKLYNVLQDFGIRGEILGCQAGPIITLHEFEPSAGTRASRVIGLADDIARSMSAVSARISVISGKNAMGIELPNKKRQVIYLRELLEAQEYKNNKAFLPLILGKGIGGEPVITDLARMPHLLVAGTTGSGKSVAINAMILSLLYKMKPEQCKFIMIDPKMLELSVYDGIPHLLTPVVTEPGKAIVALKWVTHEMENRYRAMSSLGVRNINSYNAKAKSAIRNGERLTRTVQTGFDEETGEPRFEKVSLDIKALPYIVVVVDEMADLMLVAGKEIESSIQRLAQMARAAGIHLIMATQRPSVDVITGVIKANFPTRISFHVTSKIDSRTILGGQGAEQLLGMGDMLFMSSGNKIVRAHGPFVSDAEVENIVSFIKSQGFEPDYIEEVVNYDKDGGYGIGDGLNGSETSDKEEAMYRNAVLIVKRDRKPSISYIQRQLRIGYNKAANLMERMEAEGIVSQAGRNGKREILGE